MWLIAVLLPVLFLLGACQDRNRETPSTPTASALSLDASPSNRASNGGGADDEPTEEIPDEEPSAQDPILADTFQKAVSSLRDAGAISDMNDEDWAELEARFAERAAEARTRQELRVVMQEMIETLDRSHFAIIPREAAAETDVSETGPASVGLTARYADGIAIVTDVAPGSSAAEAGVRPGWQVDSVRGRSVQDFFERFGEIDSSSMAGYQRNAGLNAFMSAEEGGTVELEVIDLDGGVRALSWRRGPGTSR